MNRIRNVLLLPLGLLSILILFYVVAGALPLLDSLRASDFVFKSIPEGGAFDAIKWLSTTRIDWSVVLEAKDEIAALVLVCTIGATLATTALEIGTETELESDHELRAHGLANLASALVGGIPAFTLAEASLTYFRLGASSRLMPILRALFSLALGVAGLSLLGFVPKIMVGTLLIVFSFGLVDEWLIRARHRLSFSDYVLVLIIGNRRARWISAGRRAGILIARR